RSAVGAQVRIKLGDKVLTRQVESSTGRGNLNDFVPHFGLGAYAGGEVEITVTWPNGREKKETVEVNKRVTVEMPAPQAGEGTDSGPKE
ncbi:MAG: ASPIC/UnbV domain-containing protein, partial [Lentisphaeria bacterium]|nr:ASPIC/UnbV domain-containing protein [Lentisphaeria bacterium]